MDTSTLDILCCPICKGVLTVETSNPDEEQLSDGTLFCSRCRHHYCVSGGVPDFYIPDDQAVERSGETRFQDLIITHQKLEHVNCYPHTQPKYGSFAKKQELGVLLSGVAWILVLYAALSVISLVGPSPSASPSLFTLLVFIALLLFTADYYVYRASMKSEHFSELHTLHALSTEQRLSEHDIRAAKKDDAANFDFTEQHNFVGYKGAWIRSVLERRASVTATGSGVIKGLNVGCGGTLHNPVSRPYFEYGFTMTGVDVNRDYIEQYVQDFATDGVVANCMSLPFKPNTFDLVNFTDILEHLHHPLLGLQEAEKVLKAGGLLLLSTNNRCALKSLRCLNPFVTAERVISVYDDRVLPPRSVLGKWMDFQFYHTEFSKNEITQLVDAAGLSLLQLETRYPFHGFLTVLSTVFQKIPILRYVCSEFFLVATKDLEPSK